MKIINIGKPKVIMNNPHGKNNYFGWPSVARLQNGKIAVVASGYRYFHVCPFGKAVISYSEDNGETYTIPAPVIDTPLDDRDAGILPFGESNVIVTSFNNSIAFQRSCNKENRFINAYLDSLSVEDEEKYLGSEFRISSDCGVTFGEIHKSPITSPHGPTLLQNGTILWVGRTFSSKDVMLNSDEVQAHIINPDGTMKYLGSIPNISKNGHKLLSCEPSTLELPDGRLMCHLRVQGSGVFTIYQSVSQDRGFTWSEPRQLLSDTGGAPAHLLRHSSGTLISTYGYREAPFGIKAMFSDDNGENWDSGHILYINNLSADLGYPCTIELNDKSLLTVFYAQTSPGVAVIMQQKWRIEK